MIHTEKLSTSELLLDYVQIMDELRARNVIRTSNNPVGDYAEWLVASCLGLRLETSSTSGYDATDAASRIKYQIKARRVTKRNNSRQLGAIRNLAGCRRR